MANSSLDRKFDQIKKREEEKTYSTNKRSRIVNKFLNKQNLVKSSKNAIDKLKIQLKRRSISIDKAKRNLDETEIKAPFDGIIASVNILPGSVINKNEKLGTLLDPNSLEVMFNLSTNEFARVIDKDGKLLNLDITAYLKLSNKEKLIQFPLFSITMILCEIYK